MYSFQQEQSITVYYILPELILNMFQLYHPVVNKKRSSNEKRNDAQSLLLFTPTTSSTGIQPSCSKPVFF